MSISIENVERCRRNIIPKIRLTLERHGYLAEYAQRLRRTRMSVIGELEYYVDKALRSIEANGAHAYFARDVNDVRDVLRKIVGSNRIVVMGKSSVLYELGVRGFLIELRNEVWETDLGEFIVQLADEPPSHILAPAHHRSKEEVALLLRERLGAKINERSIEDTVVFVRSFLRDKFVKADIGITGANAIAADTGSIFLVENEGNIRLTTSLPYVHIVITSIEKIVPSISDAFIQCLVQSAYAGLYPPTYISVISGPSSTADIECQRVTPSHGPKELHVILVDNGRIRASKDEVLKDALLCIKCGRCCWHCPIFLMLDGIFGIPPYTGPMGLAYGHIVYGDAISPYLALCLQCASCRTVCPMEIDLPRIIHELKSRLLKSRGASE